MTPDLPNHEETAATINRMWAGETPTPREAVRALIHSTMCEVCRRRHLELGEHLRATRAHPPQPPDECDAP